MADNMNLAGVTARIAGRSAPVAPLPIVVANGARGGLYIGDTTSRTNDTWTAVQVLADAVFDSTTVCTLAGLVDASLTITAGTILYGTWTTIKLSSGKVIAYN